MCLKIFVWLLTIFYTNFKINSIIESSKIKEFQQNPMHRLDPSTIANLDVGHFISSIKNLMLIFIYMC